MALARPAWCWSMVLADAVLLTLVGLALGLLAAFGIWRVVDSLLFGVGPSDPVTFGAVALLLVVALGASALPV